MEQKNMTEIKEHFHGSDLEKIERFFGIPKEQITGFGANVNPLGVSPKMRRKLADSIGVITSYPDPDYKNLREQIAAYTGCLPEQILPGNGCTELISLFIQLLDPKGGVALIVAPTYSEYEREVRLAGGSVSYYALKETDGFQLNIDEFCQILASGPRLCILCNPNNPTSTAVEPDRMRRILECCRSHGVFLIIDETYAEFAPDDVSVSSVELLKEYDNFVILRGISKFFAAPGLRLGYAMTANLPLLARVKERQNPWTLNSLADAAGALMFSDTDYIRKTRHLISSERERIYRELMGWKQVKVYKPYANFILVRILKEGITSCDVFVHAIKKGLMLRDCSSFPGLEDGTFFRFCFLMPEQNDALLDCLREILD